MENVIVENEKRVWIEALRIVCALAVIMIHISGSVIKNPGFLYESEWIGVEVFHSVTRFAVGCFVMISGALFLNPGRQITISGMVTKYVRKIVILFLVWSTFYTIYYIISTILSEQPISKMTTVYIWTTGYYHLWYLYLIAGLYLITPFLQKVVVEKKYCEYFIILCFVFYFIPNLFQTVPKLYDIYAVIMEDNLQLHFVMGYVGYYVLGYYLDTFEMEKSLRCGIYLAGLVGMLYGVLGGVFLSRNTGTVYELTYSEVSLPTVLYSVAVFTFFKFKLNGCKMFVKYKKMILKIGEYTLGIYATHALWVELFARKIFQGCQYQWTAIVIVLMAFAFFVMSLLWVCILKKIPIINRWVV